MAQLNRCLRHVVAVAALVIGSTAAMPAWSLDDDGKKNIFSSVGELFTLGDQSNRDIQYRDRPPLVMPPSAQTLPAPRAPAAADTGWMHDRKTSGRRNPTAVARSADPDRGTLTEPPNDYFRKQGTKPLPNAGRTQSAFGGIIDGLNPFRKDDE